MSQAAPVRVKIPLRFTVGEGDSWPISGITGKCVTVTAAGIWTGNIDIMVSSDGIEWLKVDTINSAGPQFCSFEIGAAALRLDPTGAGLTGDPSATLTGISQWGEV